MFQGGFNACNDLPQAVLSDSLLYVDYTCIVFQHKSVIEIEKQQIRDFSSFCDWLAYTSDKTTQKSILFGTRHINFEILSP